jgi:hypothetical protein
MQLDPVETFEHHGLTVEIHLDTEPASPREWDNLGEMVAFPRLSREYTKSLYDRESTSTEDDAVARGGTALLARYLSITEGAIVVPFYFADYGSSGARMWATEPDTDDTDSGFFVVDRDTIIKEYGDDSEASRQRAYSCLKAEIATMSQYVEGDVYGYIITGHEQPELGDSCWGFFGTEECIAEAKSMAEWLAHEEAINTDPDVEGAIYAATRKAS